MKLKLEGLEKLLAEALAELESHKVCADDAFDGAHRRARISPDDV